MSTPESQSLRVDLLRYILAVIHPTNEQLNAGLVPRWAVCGWLINTCTSVIDAANLKLALFYDWLLYDPKKDNIMLIEPAMLLMYNSMKINATTAAAAAAAATTTNVNVTSMLFDFLCRISTNYYWPIREQILTGIMHSFKDSVEKRVIPSLQVFFVNNQIDSNAKSKEQQQPALDRELKNLVQNTFGDFFQTLNINQSKLVAGTIMSTQAAIQTPQILNSSQQQQQQTQIKPLMMNTDVTFVSSSTPSSNSFMPITNAAGRHVLFDLRCEKVLKKFKKSRKLSM